MWCYRFSMTNISHSQMPTRFEPYTDPHPVEEPLIEPSMARDWLLDSGRAEEGPNGDLRITVDKPLSWAAHAVLKAGQAIPFSEAYRAVAGKEAAFLAVQWLPTLAKRLLRNMICPHLPHLKPWPIHLRSSGRSRRRTGVYRGRLCASLSPRPRPSVQGRKHISGRLRAAFPSQG